MVEIGVCVNVIPWQKHEDKLILRSIQFSFEVFVNKCEENHSS